MKEQKKEINKIDDKAPKLLELVIRDSSGREWVVLDLESKIFSTGSKGFYVNGKMKNPDNPDCKYQIGCNITLIGSKPEVKNG